MVILWTDQVVLQSIHIIKHQSMTYNCQIVIILLMITKGASEQDCSKSNTGFLFECIFTYIIHERLGKKSVTFRARVCE